jgi:hypothetical protein
MKHGASAYRNGYCRCQVCTRGPRSEAQARERGEKSAARYRSITGTPRRPTHVHQLGLPMRAVH